MNSLAPFESDFDMSTSYMLVPSTRPSPCVKNDRWDFRTANPFETPPPFVKQSTPSRSVPDASTTPIMSDGRQFTDYRPHDVTQLMGQNMMSSHELRQRRIQNGDKIMQTERQLAKDNVGCKIDPNSVGTMLPEQDRFVCDKVGCQRVDTPYACMGMGTGRQYEV